MMGDILEARTPGELCEAIDRRLSALTDELRGQGVSIVWAYELADPLDPRGECMVRCGWHATPSTAIGLTVALEDAVRDGLGESYADND